MKTVHAVMDQQPRPIIYSLAFVIMFFVAACAFNDVIPICHYLFGCDHAMHVAA